MQDASPHRPAWSRPADRAILDCVASRGVDAPALVAERIGLHPAYVEFRCETLVRQGLLEAGPDGAAYRATARGHRAAETGVLPE